MKKNKILKAGLANAALLCGLCAINANAQTQTTVYDMANDVKHYSVENVYDPIVSGDVDEKVRWDTLARGIGCCGQHAHISCELGIIFVSNRDILLYDGRS